MQPFSCKSKYESSIIIPPGPAGTQLIIPITTSCGGRYVLSSEISGVVTQRSFYRTAKQTPQLWNGPRGPLRLGRCQAGPCGRRFHMQLDRMCERMCSCWKVTAAPMRLPLLLHCEGWAWLYVAKKVREKEKTHTLASSAACRASRGETTEGCEWISRKTWERCHVSVASDHKDEKRGGGICMWLLPVSQTRRPVWIISMNVKRCYGWRETWWCATTQTDSKVKSLETWKKTPLTSR